MKTDENYEGIDAFNLKHLNIETEDLHLIIIGSLKHFLNSLDKELVIRYINTIKELVPVFSNETILKMYNNMSLYIEKNQIICKDEWNSLKSKLEETNIVSSKISSQ